MTDPRRRLAVVPPLVALAVIVTGTSLATVHGLHRDGRSGAYDGMWLFVHLIAPLLGLAAGALTAMLLRRSRGRVAGIALLWAALGIAAALVAMFLTSDSTTCINEFDPGNQECGIATLFVVLVATAEMALLGVMALIVWAVVLRRERGPVATSGEGD